MSDENVVYTERGYLIILSLVFYFCSMGFLNTFPKKSSNVSVAIPPEVAARISVMSDHMAAADMSISDDVTLHEPVSIPIGALEMPHGPFSAEDPGLANVPTTNVQPVSQASVESSPFLQDLTPESLSVSQKVKPQVESPMFLTEKNQEKQFGFGQAKNFSQVSLSDATQQSEKKQTILLREDNPVPSQKPWWMLGIFLVIILAALGGAYYYFYVYSVKLNDAANHTIPQPTTVVSVPDSEKPTFEFSLVSPNYLPVNVETISIGEFRSQLEEIGIKMKSAHITTPVEFFITDKTNTPVAFSRFVILVGLKLPENVVSMTEERFSLFLFDDQGRSRVGLRISLKGDKTTEETLKKAEVEFPFIFQNLFLESKMVPQKKYVFRESLHNGLKIRYANISVADALAIDYSLDGNNWFLATSKNTLRAVLDTRKK